jgi:hypothetical protein
MTTKQKNLRPHVIFVSFVPSWPMVAKPFRDFSFSWRFDLAFPRLLTPRLATRVHLIFVSYVSSWLIGRESFRDFVLSWLLKIAIAACRFVFRRPLYGNFIRRIDSCVPDPSPSVTR